VAFHCGLAQQRGVSGVHEGRDKKSTSRTLGGDIPYIRGKNRTSGREIKDLGDKQALTWYGKRKQGRIKGVIKPGGQNRRCQVV